MVAEAGITLSVRDKLVIPEIVAVMLVVPLVIPVAKPAEDIVAAFVLELFHVTWEEIFSVDLSEKVAIAVNC